MPKMPSEAEVSAAYEHKLLVMVNEGRIDTSKLDAIAERVIVEILREQLGRIVFELSQIVRMPVNPDGNQVNPRRD